jgi:hypothetical protein
MPGLLTVRDASNTIKHYAISGGFLEVSDNKAIILADAMEGVDEIDTARARGGRRAPALACVRTVTRTSLVPRNRLSARSTARTWRRRCFRRTRAVRIAARIHKSGRGIYRSMLELPCASAPRVAHKAPLAGLARNSGTSP